MTPFRAHSSLRFFGPKIMLCRTICQLFESKALEDQGWEFGFGIVQSLQDLGVSGLGCRVGIVQHNPSACFRAAGFASPVSPKSPKPWTPRKLKQYTSTQQGRRPNLILGARAWRPSLNVASWILDVYSEDLTGPESSPLGFYRDYGTPQRSEKRLLRSAFEVNWDPSTYYGGLNT